MLKKAWGFVKSFFMQEEQEVVPTQDEKRDQIRRRLYENAGLNYDQQTQLKKWSEFAASIRQEKQVERVNSDEFKSWQENARKVDQYFSKKTFA